MTAAVGIDDRRRFRFAVRVERGPGDGSGFLGSGFIAAPGLVLTCPHVVKDVEAAGRCGSSPNCRE